MRSAKAIKTLITRKLVRKCKTLKEDVTNEKKYALAQHQLQLMKVDTCHVVYSTFITLEYTHKYI